MGKIGVNLSIDVKSIEKARLVHHTNGKAYLNMTVFIDPNNPGQYGDHGMITQDVSKEEKAQGVKGPILGNAKIFWSEAAQPPAHQPPQAAPQQQQQAFQNQQAAPGAIQQYQMEQQPKLPSSPQGQHAGYAPQQQAPQPQGFDNPKDDGTIPF